MNERDITQKAIEFYDAIQQYAGQSRGVHEPFAAIFSLLMRHRFDFERVMKATDPPLPNDNIVSGIDDSPPPVRKYERLSIDMDISQTSLSEVAQKIGPAFSYNLYVASPYLNYTRRIAASLLADNKDNPFAPYLNVCLDDSLSSEWYLEANGKRVGSRMV